MPMLARVIKINTRAGYGLATTADSRVVFFHKNDHCPVTVGKDEPMMGKPIPAKLLPNKGVDLVCDLERDEQRRWRATAWALASDWNMDPF